MAYYIPENVKTEIHPQTFEQVSHWLLVTDSVSVLSADFATLLPLLLLISPFGVLGDTDEFIFFNFLKTFGRQMMGMRPVRNASCDEFSKPNRRCF